jgi:hypothetical protein
MCSNEDALGIADAIGWLTGSQAIVLTLNNVTKKISLYYLERWDLSRIFLGCTDADSDFLFSPQGSI